MTHKTLPLLVLCLLPGAAAAQPAGGEVITAVRKDARLHVGPLYLSPDLQLKDLGVDTNVFNDQVEPKSDFTFNVSPGLDVWVPVARRALLTTSLSTDLVWYATYKSERAINPRLTSRGDLFFHRVTLFAENAYVSIKGRANPEIDLRTRSIDNTFSAGGAYHITRKFSIEVSGRRSFVEYQPDAVVRGTFLADTLNMSTVGFGVGVRHRLSNLTTLLLQAEQSEDRFPYAKERESRSLRLVPGIEFKPAALINGSAAVGFRRFAPKNAVLPGYTGLVARLGLSSTVRGATTFGATLDRDLDYSFQRLSPYYVNTRYGASIRQAIGRHFDALVSADWSRSAYRDLVAAALASPSPAAEPRRLDTMQIYAGSLGYRLGPTTRVGAGVVWTQRESNTAAFRNYDGMGVRISVTSGVPR